MKFVRLILIPFVLCAGTQFEVDPRNTKVWGPGLHPTFIILPARYLFVQFVDTNGRELRTSVGEKPLNVTWMGLSPNGRPCRIWLDQMDRYDGSYIIRYKLYHSCINVELTILYKDQHVGNSPYKIPGVVLPEDCPCPVEDYTQWMELYECKIQHSQIDEDLRIFPTVNFTEIRPLVINTLNNPARTSFCNYVIKDNKVYRKCYGQHVGFKTFMDATLLSLTRKVQVPDLEFFINLGDWPLIRNSSKLPMFSWCGSDDTLDIVLPTYDLTEATLESMGRVMLDVLAVQSHSRKMNWNDKIEKIFWRGRDSSPQRIELMKLAQIQPELFNVSIVHYFFYRDQEKIYPKSKYISFFEFFTHKYQLNLDGTVAAYRFPYLLTGNSVVFKQDSKYYEHFYKQLKPYVHYIPITRNLSNLTDQVKWAMDNDNEALRISLNAQKFAHENLLPHNIICYHAELFQKWSSRITSTIEVLEGMEYVPQIEADPFYCKCNMNDFVSSHRDEL